MAKPRPANPVVLTREQCREFDRFAIEQLGIPGVVLMENAGRNAADLIERWLMRRVPADGTGSVAIVCGKGNNGGDGFVIARHLTNRGIRVSLDLAAAPQSLTGDAALNCRIAAKMQIPMHGLEAPGDLEQAAARWSNSRVLVDALLGTGFSGEVREPLAGIIQAINAAQGPLVVAIDVPSGLDADTGEAHGPAVEADRTITFLAAKPGYSNPRARRFLGEVSVCDIGAPLDFKPPR